MSEEKVLLISQVFYPDEVAVANLFTNLCSAFVRNNVELEVWCAQPAYTTFERQPRSNTYQGIDIHYLISSNIHKDKFYGRILNFLTFSLSVTFKLLNSRQRFLVISHTTPPFLAIVISFICRIKKLDNLYVLMDIFPEGLIKLGRASLKNPLIRIWQKLHLSAIRKCAKIVVIGRDMKEWLLSIYPEGEEKIEYIPLWQDEDLIKPLSFENNPFVLEQNLNDKFVVQYSGNMGLWNEMKTFGEAVNRRPENMIFIFIGGGMRQKELIESFDNKNPDNVLIFPFLPNNTYSYSVSACHVALVSFRKGCEGMAVPSKIIGIMAAGIPVIALVPVNSEIAIILKEEKCGIVVEPGDIEGLLSALDLLKSDEKLRAEFGFNGHKAFQKKYTLNIVAAQYISLIRQLERK